MKKLMGLAMLMFASAAFAQDGESDCEGCKDHPLLSRYPGSTLVGYDHVAFDEQAYPVGAASKNEDGERVAPKTESVSGTRTRLLYLAPEGRSGLEVFENYRQALAKAGFSLSWTCSGDEACGPGFVEFATDRMHLDLTNTLGARQGFSDADQVRYAIARLARPQGDVTVAVLAADLEFHTPKVAGVYVAVSEAKPMDTGLVSLDAGALDKNLLATGKAIVYGIHFDFDKAEIKPDSKPQLDEIAKLLKQQPDLKLAITGHTDNQGKADYNQKLSQRRADAIVAALVKDYGIAADRLSAQGMGAAAPVASNDGEEGRAKNRRVELVKQ